MELLSNRIGRRPTRTWSRQDATNALVASYAYNDAGDMTGIDYSDSTPDVTFTVDRMGRQKTASSSVSSHEFSYNAYLQLSTETIVRASLTNVIDRSFDGLGRNSGFDLDSDYEVAYGYDGYGRMNSVSNSVLSVGSVANYSYLQNSDLLQGMTSSAGSATLREYESSRNLLTSIENKFDTNTISKYAYNNDAGGRRTSVVQTGAAFEPVGDMFNLYDYNTRSEVVDAVRYFRPYSVEHVGGQSRPYLRNVGGQVGFTKTYVTVTVNTNTATRQDYYWYHRLEVDNLYTAAYPQVVVEAVFDPGTNDPYVVSSETGNVFVAASPEEFAYDDDGNTLSDGRFTYTWDAENRLISAITTTNLPADVPVVHVAFDYDYQSRRVGKTVYEWDEGITNWTETASSTFVYDGWNLVQEISDEDSEVSTNSYVWGLDLSGSLQGAGGIGGLLSVIRGTNAYFPTFDGNGNVSEYVDASGEIAAHYEYSPFGETIVATGSNASDFLHRFSTKPAEDNTGLVLYEYRPYSPSMGRWLSRDPAEEEASLNLYGARLLNAVDLLGLWTIYPWVTKEIDARGLRNRCSSTYGSCGYSHHYIYQCDLEVGVVDLYVTVYDYWYASNLGSYSAVLKKAEQHHYESTKTLYDQLHALAIAHNKVYPSICECEEKAQEYEERADEYFAAYQEYNLSLEIVHNRYARKLQEIFCRQ